MTSGLFPSEKDNTSSTSGLFSAEKETKNRWTVDNIIQKIFPILGVLLIAGGLGYFFYTGFWENIGKEGRLALGFFAGAMMVLGGYSFEKKLPHLKYFADSIIGGGILLLYVTLIYGSRFDVADQLTSFSFPESFALIVSFLFCGAISFYALERKSSLILIIGMIGAYATPFFIGQIGGFETGDPYNISYLQFLIYFLAINIALLISSFRLNLISLIGANALGLFIGTLSLSGLIGEGMGESPYLVSLTAFAIVIAQIIFISMHAKKFNIQNTENNNGLSAIDIAYIAPLVWISIVIFGALDNQALELFSGISLKAFVFVGISFTYFFIWKRFEENRIQLLAVPENSPSPTLHNIIYALGVISGGLAFWNISELLGGYAGICLSLISFSFAFLHISRPRKSRELAFLGTAILGALITIAEQEHSGKEIFIFSLNSLLISFSLLPFLTHFFMKEEGASELTDSIRTTLAYLSAIAITLILGIDAIEDIDIRKDFLFATLPAGVLAIIAFFNKDPEKKLEYTQASLILLAIGYFITFFSFWDKLFPAHTDLPFSTAEGLIGFFSLFISLILVKNVKQLCPKNNAGTHFMVVASSIIIAFQFVSFEIIAMYNVVVDPSLQDQYLDQIGEDSAIVGGLRAVLISFWWVILSSFLLFLGIKNSDKYLQEKRIGMTLLAFTLGKIFLYDISHLDTNLKVLLFMITGAIILGLSYFLNTKKGSTS
jgi:hypothetical protein